MSILANRDTLQGIVVLFLLIFFGSGQGFKVVGKLLRKWAES